MICVLKASAASPWPRRLPAAASRLWLARTTDTCTFAQGACRRGCLATLQWLRQTDVSCHEMTCAAAHLHVLLAIIVVVDAMRNHLASSPVCTFLAIATDGCACRGKPLAQPQFLACKRACCPVKAHCCSTVACLMRELHTWQSAEANVLMRLHWSIGPSQGPCLHTQGSPPAGAPAQYTQAGAPIQQMAVQAVIAEVAGWTPYTSSCCRLGQHRMQGEHASRASPSLTVTRGS